MLLHQVTQRIRVDPALWQIGGVQHLYAEPLLQGQILNLIRRVVAARGNDGISGLEVDRAQGLGEACRGVRDHSDVSRSRVQQGGDIFIALLDLRHAGIGGLVASEVCLEFEMGDGRTEHRRRHECSAGIIEVDANVAPGGIGAPLSQACIHERLHENVSAIKVLATVSLASTNIVDT